MTEIKSYGRPPILVEKVMEAVMILRGVEPTWSEAKRNLGKTPLLLSGIVHLSYSHKLFGVCRGLCRWIGLLCFAWNRLTKPRLIMYQHYWPALHIYR